MSHEATNWAIKQRGLNLPTLSIPCNRIVVANQGHHLRALSLVFRAWCAVQSLDLLRSQRRMAPMKEDKNAD